MLNANAPITSVITSIRETLKEKYNIAHCESVKLIYRGFYLNPETRLAEYNVNPEYVIMAIVR